MSGKQRLLIIGLDGADWGVIDDLAEQGLLPVIARLRREGAWAPLTSTVPPATFPAWTTFMTGCNPGRHGVFDFTRRRPGTYSLEFVNATYRKAPTLWHILSQAGLRVGVVGLPATYPPEQVNGCMVSGFDSPVAATIDASFVHPPELLAEMNERCGGYRISSLLENYMDSSWYPHARTEILESVQSKARSGLYLYRREPWDCFMMLFGETDTVAHHFWKFHDSDSPRHEPAPALRSTLTDVYRAADAIVGRFLEQTWENTTVLLVSDHGSGGIGDTAVSLNRWLEAQGLLISDERNTWAGRAVEALKGAGLRRLPQRVQEQVFRTRAVGLAERMESRSRFGGIVWEKTAAFSEDMNYFPAVHINLRNREPTGQVSPGPEYDRLCARILEGLHAWRHPVTGTPVVRSAWHRRDLYCGDWTETAPDIAVEFALHNGYSPLCLHRRHLAPGQCLTELSRQDMRGSRILSMSGAHRSEGIFLCHGPGLNDFGRVPAPVSLADICPSVLRFFGVRWDGALDGQPLNCLRPGASGPSIRGNGCDSGPRSSQPYSTSQEQAVAERLRRLGYID